MTAADATAAARPLVLGASATGPSHARDGRPCQDAFAVRILDRGRVVVAVADGLGSAARSDLGARAAVDAAIDGDDVVLEQRVAAARTALEHRAAEEGCALRDLACTLIVVVADQDGVRAAHIGDGAVVAQTGEELMLLSGPAPSEYVNEVDPLTADSWAGALRISEVETGARAVVAFTDGCAHAALTPSGEPHPGFVGALVDWARGSTDPDAADTELAALLGGTKLSEHSDDDKTLVLALIED